jgi:hypothetical protein
LEAVNGSNDDAVVSVKVSGGRRRIRAVYVRKWETVEIKDLGPGDYDILFQTGMDYDRSTRHFKQDASYFQFGKVLSFEEKRDREGIHYEKHTITLYPVLDGNVESRSLTDAEYSSLGGDSD